MEKEEKKEQIEWYPEPAYGFDPNYDPVPADLELEAPDWIIFPDEV